MRKNTTQIKTTLRQLNGHLQGAEMLPTPVGLLYAAAGAKGLFVLRFVDETGAGGLPVIKGNKHIASLRRELEQYFKGALERFETPVKFESGTEFQQKVWKQLARIPFGKTKTYQEIAVAVGTPTAYRAVGLANGSNPVAIVVPCHRVINASGHLGGYAGGISRKLKLLEHEGHRISTKGQLLAD